MAQWVVLAASVGNVQVVVVEQVSSVLVVSGEIETKVAVASVVVVAISIAPTEAIVSATEIVNFRHVPLFLSGTIFRKCS